MPDRVMVFIDGSNVYRAFKAVYGSGKYDVVKLGVALAAGRPLVKIHFYTGAVTQQMGKLLYADQQRFFSHLKRQPQVNLWTRRMVNTNGVWHEKGVDVQIATHMVAMANRDEYDVAVLASGDSDLVPAVVEVIQQGRVGPRHLGAVPGPTPRIAWIMREQSPTLTPTLSLSGGEGAISSVPSPPERERARAEGGSCHDEP